MSEEVRLEWGHTVLDPDGRKIQVPAKAIVKLRRLGLLKKSQGRFRQISAAIYDLMKPEYDSLTDGLRRLIGEDLEGPKWLVCRCRECKQQRDMISRELEQLGLFKLDMAVQQSAR